MNTVNKVFIRWLDRIMSITCLSCEVGVHWLLWQACKKQMIMQNRQSNTKNTHKNKLLLFNYLLKADILINYWNLIFLLITESWYSYYLLKADILIINWKLIFLLFTESWWKNEPTQSRIRKICRKMALNSNTYARAAVSI